jgi:integral membrane sensor domain MASE1
MNSTNKIKFKRWQKHFLILGVLTAIAVTLLAKFAGREASLWGQSGFFTVTFLMALAAWLKSFEKSN